MKNYYFILGVSIYARESEIKAAYRKLAFQFHPDVNPSPEAEARFKEINEAYEVLSDQAARGVYDQLLTGSVVVEEAVTEQPRRHRDPRYRPKPAGTYKSRRREILEMMERYLPFALNISRVTLLFVLILLADYLLPGSKSNILIVDQNQFGKFNSSVIQTNDGKIISISQDRLHKFGRGSAIIIYTSPLFGVPRKVENEQTHYVSKIEVSIYGNFIFGPLVLLITSALGAFYEKGVEFRFNLGVVNFLLLLLNFLFLQIHKF